MELSTAGDYWVLLRDVIIAACATALVLSMIWSASRPST